MKISNGAGELVELKVGQKWLIEFDVFEKNIGHVVHIEDKLDLEMFEHSLDYGTRYKLIEDKDYPSNFRRLHSLHWQ